MPGGRHTNRRAKPERERKGKDIQTPAPHLLVPNFPNWKPRGGDSGRGKPTTYFPPPSLPTTEGLVGSQRPEEVACSWQAPLNWSPSGSWADLSPSQSSLRAPSSASAPKLLFYVPAPCIPALGGKQASQPNTKHQNRSQEQDSEGRRPRCWEMWLKLAAGFSDGPGAHSLPCLSQPPCALGSSLVPSEKEEIGSFPSVFGPGFKKAPAVCPLSLWNLPLHQSPGTYGRLHSSYLFLWLGVALCPQVEGPAVGGAEGRGRGPHCPFRDIPAAEPVIPGARRDQE